MIRGRLWEGQDWGEIRKSVRLRVLYLLRIHRMAAGRDPSVWNPVELSEPEMGH